MLQGMWYVLFLYMDVCVCVCVCLCVFGGESCMCMCGGSGGRERVCLSVYFMSHNGVYCVLAMVCIVCLQWRVLP